MVFLPFFHNKNLEFSLESIKGQVQIVAYLAKSVGEQFKSRPILDLEAFAILNALHSFNRYISNTKTILLTDSRVLYYLFHQRIGDSSIKIRRWVLKIICDFPFLVLHFISTHNNLADYLSRQGMLKGDLQKLCLKDVKIEEFVDKLPKLDFSLQEWTEYCTANPQYLTINQTPTVMQITKSINRGIDNIRDIVSPLDILRQKFNRDIIIREQKQQFKEIYEQCLSSPNFEFETENEKGQVDKYKLVLDLLMCYRNGEFKIYVPDKLIGVLLAYTHLLGHLGTGRMLKNMESYYFPSMYSTVKSFASKCYSCFLMHGSSRKTKIGTYPVPEYPMEEIGLDLIENLNTSKGYNHILVAQDALTDFVLLFPLRTKTAGEVSRIFKYSIFQNYNIKRIHSDNGPCFRNGDFLNLMAELKVEVINTSVNNPSARGKIEREVAIIKKLFKKFLATSSTQTLHWENLPLMASKIMNHVVSPRTGFKPATMMFGEGPMSQCFMDLDTLVPKHHSIRNNKRAIIQLSAEIKKITEVARETIIAGRQQAYDSLNENRIDKDFKKNDIVFLLDRSYVQGAPRPLRTKFSPSPYIVIKNFYTTVLIMRLADNFKTLVSKDDIKRYKGTDPAFNDLPQEIKRILVNDFKDLVVTDFNEILRLDTLDVPNGIELHAEPDEKGRNKNKQRAKYGKDDQNLENEELVDETETEIFSDDEEEEEDPYDEYEGNPDANNISESQSVPKVESASRQERPENIPSGSNTQYSPSSSSITKTIRPIVKGPSSKRDKSEKLGKHKSIIKTQNNSQLDRIEEEPSETVSENDFEENGTTNVNSNLLKRTTKNTCKTDSIQRPDSDEDDDDDSMKLRSGRRVRFKK